MRMLALMLILVISQIVSAVELKGADIIDKCFALYRLAENESEINKVTIDYANGREEQKSFTRWIQFSPDHEDKVTIKFDEPAMDNGLALLIFRHENREDEQWLKLPSWNRIRKVAVNDQSKYFGGTDVTYEDARQFIGERTQDFTYNIVTASDNGWQIEALPKAATNSGYSRRLFTIDSHFVCTAIEYYGADGSLIKKQENSEIEVKPSGLWRADKVVIVNNNLKRTTTFLITARKFNEVNERTFTKNFILR